MEWIEARLATTHEGVEAVCAMLLGAGVPGMQVEDPLELKNFLETAENQWDYVDEALLQADGDTCVVFYLSDNGAGHETLLAVKEGINRLQGLDIGLDLGTLQLTMNQVEDTVWLNAWKAHYKPFGVGKKLVIKPEWEPYAPKDGEVVVTLNPGHVFGTGLHQTTQLCMANLETHLPESARVLDLGCGSGVLSITALLLGAAYAHGVDIDPNAADIAYANAGLNGIDKARFDVTGSNILSDEALQDAFRKAPFDVVVANIVADVIIALSPMVPGFLKPGGLFIASGIIDERVDEVKQAMQAYGFELLNTMEKDGWWSLAAVYKG